MHLLPTQEEILRILRETGALRWGHFELSTGRHTNQFLQLPLALRYYQHSRTLSVALSRLLRSNPEIASLVPELSIVTPASGGLPVAFGVGEALRCRQVYWAENEEGRLRFRQYMESHHGEKVVLVDDTLRTGRKLRELKTLLESGGAAILAVAVVILQPHTGERLEFDHIPIYSLAKLEAERYPDAAGCRMCHAGETLERVRS
ncbi:MAG: phosphoribosyltransferase [Acidobacteria bacterium]|nr:phosphoribosyltransferase [Acidobacteriota bacterium]